MSAGPERIFSGAKHTLASERIRLGAKMIEMAECLKSWVLITKERDHASLSGVFLNSKSLSKAIKVLEEAQGKDPSEIIDFTELSVQDRADKVSITLFIKRFMLIGS